MRAAILAAIALAGCDAGTDGGNVSVAPETLAWQPAPGGGRIARWELTGADVDYRSADAVRCWPAAGQQDCLAVSETSALGYSARRFDLPELPTSKAALDAALAAGGYSCGYVPEHGLTVETIAALQGKLVEQSWSSFSPQQPWTRAYVTRFLRDNAVGGTTWFRCVDLMLRLREGSLATIGTTAVSRSSLG